MLEPSQFRCRLAGAILLALAAAGPLFAAEVQADDPAVLSSEAMPLASQSLLLDITRTAAGLFVVGERGTVLRSSVDGTWKQLSVPTRATLTSAASAEGELWVAGHSGVILRSSDNGDTWVRQRIDIWNPESMEPAQGAPLLDVLFLNASTGFAVGAFSTLLRTVNGGQTWETLSLKGGASIAQAEPMTDEVYEMAASELDSFDDSGVLSADQLVLEDETDPHLNAIASDTAGTLYLAGERGAMYRSRDSGDTWQKLSLPYEGSMFGVLAGDVGEVMAFGLRGNVFESSDGGDSWSRLDTGTQVALMGGTALAGGGVVLVGNEGVMLTRKDGASPFERTTYQNDAGETPVLSGVLAEESGGLILIGEKGVERHGDR